MKMRKCLALAFFILFLASSCIKESTVAGDIPVAENVAVMENELIDIVNAHRSTLGKATLQFSAVAYEHAADHNDYMISKGFLSHDNFDARASSISAETNAEEVAENVARDYPTAIEAFDAWLGSTRHKDSMEGDFTHTAVSVKKDQLGNYYFTQLFYR